MTTCTLCKGAKRLDRLGLCHECRDLFESAVADVAANSPEHGDHALDAFGMLIAERVGALR